MPSNAAFMLICAAAIEEDDFDMRVLLFLATIISRRRREIKRSISSIPSIRYDGLSRIMSLLLLSQQQRATPSGASDPHNSPIARTIVFGGEVEFKRMFRLTRHVFKALVIELSICIHPGLSIWIHPGLTVERNSNSFP